MTDRVIVFNDGTGKSLYLLDYLVEEGYNPKVIDVNVASTLKERLDSIKPEGYKVFLSLSYEDLLEDNEREREVLKGLESKGWTGLIVLPFEGMTDARIEAEVTKRGLKVKEVKEVKDNIKKGTEREVSDVQEERYRGIST